MSAPHEDHTTPEDPMHQAGPTSFWVAPDGEGEPTVWTGDRERPAAVLRRCDLTASEGIRDEVMHRLDAENVPGVSGARDARVAELEAQVERLKRGGKELGRILDRSLRDVLDASGRHDVIDEDGDGDWALVWETLAELRPRAESAEAELAALRGQIEALADEWDGYGHGLYNVHIEENLPCSVCDLLRGLRAALAAEPTPAAEPHAEDGAR